MISQKGVLIMETGVKYTDCLRTLHERDVLRLTEQEKQMMCDKKFFTGMDFEIEFLVNELAKTENLKEEYDLTEEETDILQYIIGSRFWKWRNEGLNIGD